MTSTFGSELLAQAQGLLSSVRSDWGNELSLEYLDALDWGIAASGPTASIVKSALAELEEAIETFRALRISLNEVILLDEFDGKKSKVASMQSELLGRLEDVRIAVNHVVGVQDAVRWQVTTMLRARQQVKQKSRGRRR